MDWTRFWSQKPVIGMLHLPPLPGAPRATGAWEARLDGVKADAAALLEGGCHGLMLENFGDAPFYPGRVPASVVAATTRVACEIRAMFAGPLGINILRNDGCGALAVAAASGADFIRVNVLCGARVTDQGLIEGIAHELLRDRRYLQAEHVAIFADVDVKHSAALAARPLQDEVQDMLHRGMADAVIVSGSGTGAPVDLTKLQAVKKAAGGCPVVIGSGTTSENLQSMARYADGFVVGSSFKKGDDVMAPVDVARVAMLMRVHASICESH